MSRTCARGLPGAELHLFTSERETNKICLIEKTAEMSNSTWNQYFLLGFPEAWVTWVWPQSVWRALRGLLRERKARWTQEKLLEKGLVLHLVFYCDWFEGLTTECAGVLTSGNTAAPRNLSDKTFLFETQKPKVFSTLHDQWLDCLHHQLCTSLLRERERDRETEREGSQIHSERKTGRLREIPWSFWACTWYTIPRWSLLCTLR